MPIQISGVQMGTLTGGPSAITLEDLSDVSIVSPSTGQYLRYNSSIAEWQNSYIDSDVYNYLDGNLTSSNGVGLTFTPGSDTVNIALALTASGDASGSVTSGNLALTLATVNSNVGTFGSGTAIPVVTVNAKGLVTAVSTTSFTGTAPLATSLAGGAAGTVVYQSAAGATAFLAAGSTSQVLIGGTSAPSWSNTPTLTGTNFSSIPNTALTNSSLTLGSTSMSLGSTTTTVAGLTSVTSTTFVGALTGNATSATSAAALTTARSITATADASWTVSFDGSTNVSAALTLATVNGSPQTDTFRKITVNGKGLTTATSAVLASDITTALGYTPVNKAGDTMTGALILNADPATALGAATKQYVDNVASGLSAHAACFASTTATLAISSGGTVTYNNGSGGVGATLTTTGSFATIGAASTTNGDRILVKDEATQANNGVYVRTSATVLTRATDFDDSPDGEVAAGDFVYIQTGTLAGTQWVVTTTGNIIIGTTGIVFSQLSGAGTVTGGTGITVTGNSVALATGNTLSLFNLATNGLVARTAANTVTARSLAVSGTGLSVSNADGVSGNPTITSNATNANTASTIVARDASGNFTAGTVTLTAVAVNAAAISQTTTAVTTNTANTIDSFATATYRSAKYLVQVTDTTNSQYQIVEISVIHDGTTVFKTEYGQVATVAALGTFDASITTGTLNLQFTATVASTKSVKVYRTALTV